MQQVTSGTLEVERAGAGGGEQQVLDHPVPRPRLVEQRGRDPVQHAHPDVDVLAGARTGPQQSGERLEHRTRRGGPGSRDVLARLGRSHQARGPEEALGSGGHR